MATTLRSAAGSDTGRRRSMNQDSAATSPHLLALADGMGGHAHGEVASTVAITTFLELADRLHDVDLAGADLLGHLSSTIDAAAARITALADAEPEIRGTGTTVVAFLVDELRIGVLHIGDSRAYLLRDGELSRMTRDHTLVQALVDEGRISAAEAADHPRRSWLIRTLQDGAAAEPDLFLHEGRTGDRYLICSDGVTAVLDDGRIRDVLAGESERAAAVARLIEQANEGGGPDNITCIVADLVDEPAPTAEAPLVVGAAAERSRES